MGGIYRNPATMKKIILFSTLTLIFASACKEADTKKSTIDMKAPVAEKIPTTLEKHGHERIDNYYWLKEREDQKGED